MDFAAELQAIKVKITDKITNIDRRKLYGEIEALKFVLDDENTPDREFFLKQANELQSNLKFTFPKEPFSILNAIDGVIRIVAVWASLVTSTVVFIIPLAIVSAIESILYSVFKWNSQNQITNSFRRFISRLNLLVSGVVWNVSYETSFEETFNKSSIICFSHGSTMDAFLIGASIQVKIYTMAKDDLFFIPFFNLLMLVFSAIPVVRTNLDKAKQSLDYVSQCLGKNECICIAPEGTRSKTGQLLDFKKGPFHMWEHLKIPIIPMVIFGAYELFPPGNFFQMNKVGRAYVRFLKPIQYNEAKSREEMSKLLRKRFLKAIDECPEDVSAPLTLQDRLKSILGIILLFSFDFLIFQLLKHLFVFFNISWKVFWFYFGIGTLISIPVIYLYAVYVMPFLSSLFNSKKSLREKKE